MRVLLIEDEPTTAKSIELMLGTEGFNVYTTDLGEEGLDLGKLYDYDIILLDLNLPDMHGYDVLKKLRTAKVGDAGADPVGHRRDGLKVRALGFGADDYVTKPFHRDELVARIHAIVRRSKGHSQSVIRTGKLAVNLDAKTVEVDGSRVHLTGKEYAMLELLSLAQGHHADQGNVPQPPLRRDGRARAQDHRRVHLQAAQEASAWPAAATIISRPCGAAATCCATSTATRRRAGGRGRLSLPQSPGHGNGGAETLRRFRSAHAGAQVADWR